MCGIAGILGSADPALLCAAAQRMADAQKHRGPDDQGQVCLPVPRGSYVVLAHRRLSILDVSDAGHQPMSDEATGVHLIFNGEIYNFRELRRDLQGKGHHFRSSGDTEVLLRAYVAWGRDCVQRLRGIFAFAVWDPRDGSLMLARDQLGVKPLYVYSAAGTIAFASEVRALLASGQVPRRLDPSGLYSFLAFGSVQEPVTLIAGVQSLPPAHTLTWCEGRLRVERYWALPHHLIPQSAVAEPAYDELASVLQEATTLQLASDVPLGAFLSGGVDSTAVVALMQQGAEGRVQTFSVVFDEADYDEREFSRLAASRLGTTHTELLLHGADVQSGMGLALAAIDQPSVDGLNTYFVSRVTKQAGLTVALSGVGGDEIFGGYDGYHRALLAEQWGARASYLPRFARHALGSAIHRVARSERVRRLGDLIENDLAPYFVTRRLLGRRQISSLLVPALRDAYEGPSVWRSSFAELERETRDYDPINRAAAFEMRTYLLSTLLRDTDQMSMAHSLEVRVPLIDHRLVELLFQIPGRWKVDARYPKPLLTKPLADVLPAECVFREKKGFELPFARWLSGSLDEAMRESYSRLDSGGPFDQVAIHRLWRDFHAGRISWSRIWGVFVVRDWLRRHNIAA